MTVDDRALAEPSTDQGDAIRRIRRTLEGVIGVPATEGNRIAILRNGDEIFPSMLEAIGRAEHTVDLLTFVYWKGEVGTEFATALCDRAKSGVRVRVLLDAWGAHPIDPLLIEGMVNAGVHVRWFRPLHRMRVGDVNHRTHRKVLIVDESVGFTGGVGISDLWEGNARNPSEWRDTHFRIEGPAVDGLRSAFLDNWAETDPVLFEDGRDRFPDQPKPGTSLIQCVRGAAETGQSDVATLLRTLIQLARRRIRITTAYFVPDEQLIRLLHEACGRGVHVQVLLPGPEADKRFVQLSAEADYGPLLKAGVEFWNFQPSMLHAKVMTIDGLVATVGSANFNHRSLHFDEEINLVVIDPEVVVGLDDDFDADLQRSTCIEEGRWLRRSWVQHIGERLVLPFRRLS